MSDTLDVCAAIQEGLDRSEKWTDRSHMKFNKGKDIPSTGKE